MSRPVEIGVWRPSWWKAWGKQADFARYWSSDAARPGHVHRERDGAQRMLQQEPGPRVPGWPYSKRRPTWSYAKNERWGRYPDCPIRALFVGGGKFTDATSDWARLLAAYGIAVAWCWNEHEPPSRHIHSQTDLVLIHASATTTPAATWARCEAERTGRLLVETGLQHNDTRCKFRLAGLHLRNPAEDAAAQAVPDEEVESRLRYLVSSIQQDQREKARARRRVKEAKPGRSTRTPAPRPPTPPATAVASRASSSILDDEREALRWWNSNPHHARDASLCACQIDAVPIHPEEPLTLTLLRGRIDPVVAAHAPLSAFSATEVACFRYMCRTRARGFAFRRGPEVVGLFFPQATWRAALQSPEATGGRGQGSAGEG